jgi:glycerophosphoryl diester phosphodiesterase
MLVLSHRGNCADHPENTLEGFRAAAKLGVDGIETDVRLSADGLPILCHDRVAPNGREVASLTRHELAEALGHHVPTLDEALDLWAGGLWNIEIKTPSVMDIALKIIREYVSSREIIVTSFWHDILLDVERSRLRCGLLLASRPSSYRALTCLLEDFKLVEAVVWDYEILDPTLTRPLGERGIQNLVYGAKTRQEHVHCEALGLDGVITDHPQYILAKMEV